MNTQNYAEEIVKGALTVISIADESKFKIYFEKNSYIKLHDSYILVYQIYNIKEYLYSIGMVDWIFSTNHFIFNYKNREIKFKTDINVSLIANTNKIFCLEFKLDLETDDFDPYFLIEFMNIVSVYNANFLYFEYEKLNYHEKF